MAATIETLRELVERGKRQEPLLATRLEKAAFIVALRPVVREGDAWLVGSEDGLRSYRVEDGRCECSDYLRHGEGHFCKHRLAVGLYTRLHQGNGRGNGHVAKPAPAPSTCRTCGKEVTPGERECAACSIYGPRGL